MSITQVLLIMVNLQEDLNCDLELLRLGQLSWTKHEV
jgi:hypothetical protein